MIKVLFVWLMALMISFLCSGCRGKKEIVCRSREIKVDSSSTVGRRNSLLQQVVAGSGYRWMKRYAISIDWWTILKSKVIYGDEKKDRSPEERFSYIIRCANEQSGCGVVVLVDEYDKPLLQALGNFIYRISGGCQQSASIDLSERLADYQGLWQRISTLSFGFP